LVDVQVLKVFFFKVFSEGSADACRGVRARRSRFGCRPVRTPAVPSSLLGLSANRAEAFLLPDRGPAVVKLPLTVAGKTQGKPHGAGQSQMAGILFQTCRADLQGDIFSRREDDHRDVD